MEADSSSSSLIGVVESVEVLPMRLDPMRDELTRLELTRDGVNSGVLKPKLSVDFN